MQKLNKYQVSIFGEAYSLVSDETQENIMQSVKLVDSLMREIAEKVQPIDSYKMAVLVSLKLSSRILSLESEIEKIRFNQEMLIEVLDRELSI